MWLVRVDFTFGLVRVPHSKGALNHESRCDSSSVSSLTLRRESKRQLESRKMQSSFRSRRLGNHQFDDPDYTFTVEPPTTGEAADSGSPTDRLHSPADNKANPNSLSNASSLVTVFVAMQVHCDDCAEARSYGR